MAAAMMPGVLGAGWNTEEQGQKGSGKCNVGSNDFNRTKGSVSNNNLKNTVVRSTSAAPASGEVSDRLFLALSLISQLFSFRNVTLTTKA